MHGTTIKKNIFKASCDTATHLKVPYSNSLQRITEPSFEFQIANVDRIVS
jgi:hypothetical protein